MRRWLMVNTKSRGATFPHVFQQCAALLEQLQRAMARNPKASAATRTIAHVCDVYEEIGRLLHTLRERPATSNKPAQTLLPGRLVEETFRVSAELQVDAERAVERVRVLTAEVACTADVRRTEEQLENELDDLTRAFHVLKDSSTTHEVSVAELKRSTTEAMHLVMDARGEVVHCVSAIQRSHDTAHAHVREVKAAAPLAPDWVQELRTEMARLQQLPPQATTPALDEAADPAGHAGGTRAEGRSAGDARGEMQTREEAEARRAAECAFEARVRAEWARREASWEEKLHAWRAMQTHMAHIEEAWDEARDWWMHATQTIQLIDCLAVCVPSPPQPSPSSLPPIS